VLDGKEGPVDTTGLTTSVIAQQQESAYRNGVHYRNVHRNLQLSTRRVIEDPVMQDSRSSQLIQAADLTAYAAYQHLWGERQIWPRGGRHGQPMPALVKSHQRLSGRWLTDSDSGIHWVDPKSS